MIPRLSRIRHRTRILTHRSQEESIIVATILVKWASVAFMLVAIGWGIGRHLNTLSDKEAREVNFWYLLGNIPLLLALALPKFSIVNLRKGIFLYCACSQQLNWDTIDHLTNQLIYSIPPFQSPSIAQNPPLDGRDHFLLEHDCCCVHAHLSLQPNRSLLGRQDTGEKVHK